MRKNIVLSGGLGNQLFQFAFLHNLHAEVSSKIGIYFPHPEDGARSFNLEELAKNCHHVGMIRNRRSFLTDSRFQCLGFIRFRFPRLYIRFFSKIDFNEENAYSCLENLNFYSYFSGYFQNWKYVSKVIDSLETEIRPLLEKEFATLPEELRSSLFAVLHFRRGDMTKYWETMGILDRSYFERVEKEAMAGIGGTIKVVVLTDDKEAALKAFPERASYIYGPDEVSEWQALALMSKARFVITSNSTFSWWGGLLASRNGGTAYIPDPWFLNWSPDPKAAFAYPGFVSCRSTFTPII